MEEKILFKIVTPTGLIYEEPNVDEVTAPGSEGELGILPGHIPLITALNTGTVTYKKNGTIKRILVTSGYLEAGPNKILILADTAEIQETDNR
ncbi:ATPase, F1 complex, delta/epsilon subunit [Candidatus Magnetoovum chiemensis]|nr:ATPase, F1 complex, delta/epsilon subunit [Candidatus Magnetoovum chiemensis]